MRVAMVDRVLLLPVGVLIALAWANTSGESYFRFAPALRFAVNDVGMALFIGLVTEEALEAVMPGGALFRWRRTMLPVVAALGGTAGAISVYLLYLHSRYEFMLLDGWPVAAALDVTFAYFIAKAVFPRREGPIAFLLVIAIVSDALGVVSIAIWFPADDGYPAALALMAAALAIAAALRPRESTGSGPTSSPLAPCHGWRATGAAFLQRWRWCRSCHSCRIGRAHSMPLSTRRRRHLAGSSMSSGIPYRPSCCSMVSSTAASCWRGRRPAPGRC
jgi:hypothetical protein